MRRYLGVHWAEELKHQLAGQSEVLRSTGWRQPTFLQGATTQRSNEGPIGFALDVISARHADLVLALQLLASIKAEVSIPKAVGLRMRLCHAEWRSKKMNPMGPIKEREVAPSACDSFGCCHGWKAGTVPRLDIGAVT